MKGWIYIASMTNTVGVVKIGYTDRDPDKRVNEWGRSTGVPGKAEVQYAALVEDPQHVERAIHRSLSKVREPRGEWFRCDVSDAVASLKKHANVLFEDDRVAAAEEANQKIRKAELEAETKKRLAQEESNQKIQKAELEAENTKRVAQEKEERLQKKITLKAEEDYLNALARWRKLPQETLFGYIQILISAPVVVFLVLALVIEFIEFMGINVGEGVIWFAWVIMTVGVLLYAIKSDDEPKLKDFMPNKNDDFTKREIELKNKS